MISSQAGSSVLSQLPDALGAELLELELLELELLELELLERGPGSRIQLPDSSSGSSC